MGASGAGMDNEGDGMAPTITYADFTTELAAISSI